MLMHNKFQENPTGKSRCQVLASRTSNMSCSFDQSARSIEIAAWLHSQPHLSRAWKVQQDHHRTISRWGPSYWFNAVQKRITDNPWRDRFVFRNMKNIFVFSIISQQLNSAVNCNLDGKHNPVYSVQSLAWLPKARPWMGPGHQYSLLHCVETVCSENDFLYYSDVMMSMMAFQITSLTIIYSIVDSYADQRKTSKLRVTGFVRGIHRWPVNSPHKWPVTRKIFAFDAVIMSFQKFFEINIYDYCPAYGASDMGL